MKPILSILLSLVLIISVAMTLSTTEELAESVTFDSKDGLEITAVIYSTGNDSNPWILLCHQARWSRGEYTEIAPKLVAQGYNCIAIDQRSGKEINGVKNETAAKARDQKLGTEYLDAIPDIEAALEYVQKNKKPSKLILWGSSYSSTLAFVMAAKYPKDIQAVMSFAPGDYFQIDRKSIADFASEVKCPVFITSAKSEGPQWQGIYKAISSEKSSYLPKTEGRHGASALWESTEGHEGYWEAVTAFLKSIK